MVEILESRQIVGWCMSGRMLPADGCRVRPPTTPADVGLLPPRNPVIEDRTMDYYHSFADLSFIIYEAIKLDLT